MKPEKKLKVYFSAAARRDDLTSDGEGRVMAFPVLRLVYSCRDEKV